MAVPLLLETLSPTALVGVLSLVALASLVVGRVLSNSLPGKRPPIFEGIPFFGGFLKFVKGPWYLLQDGYKKYGEVFTVPIFHKRITFLIGPEVAPHFFKATDEEMSQYEVYNYSVPTFGKGVVYDVDKPVRIEQFRFFTEALKKERLKKYVPQFVMEAEQYFAKWGDSGVIDFKEEFSKLITLTAARTLLGREVREQMFEKVADLLHDLDAGMIPLSVLNPYIPIPCHRQRDRARKDLSEIFAKIIRNRRANGIVEEDVLQQFMDAKYQNVYNGRGTTEDECTGLLIAALFAGQHTSSITSSWTGLFMSSHKKALEAAKQEQRETITKFGEEITFDILEELPVLHRNITEALRLHPPLLLVLRYARTAFSVTDSKGRTYHIPKGDVVAASPNFSHTLPTVFKNPLVYDPDRFAPPREEDKVKPFSFIGFGGGRHACIGSNFAYLQIKSIWSVLLRNFEFELLDPVPGADYESMVVGPKPCRVKYVRRKL